MTTRANGCWDGVSCPLDSSPRGTARTAIEEALPEHVTARFVRAGAPVSVREGDVTWQRYPFLVDVDAPATSLSGRVTWVRPPAVRGRPTVPGLWRAYRRCGPSLETVRADEEHGSAYVSLRAIEALRDRAVEAIAPGPADEGWSELCDYALRLATCRPELVAVGVRIDRVMSAMTDRRDPRGLVDRCEEVLTDAMAADQSAADRAGARLRNAAVATLSRSNTVINALRGAEPSAIWIFESRPDREGVDTAETLCDGDCPVTLTVDAAAGHLLAGDAIDLVLVGADAIGPTGTIRNKVGTRTLAQAAMAGAVPVVVVTAVDKISPTPLDDGPAGPTAPVYDGDQPVDVAYPLFDRTPSDAISTVCTDDGELASTAIQERAAIHADRRRWRATAAR